MNIVLCPYTILRGIQSLREIDRAQGGLLPPPSLVLSRGWIDLHTRPDGDRYMYTQRSAAAARSPISRLSPGPVNEQ